MLATAHINDLCEDDLAPNFGVYASIVKVATAEILLSIYNDPDRVRVPYFALVQFQKRLLRALVNDRYV